MFKPICLFVLLNTIKGAGWGLLAAVPAIIAVGFDWPISGQLAGVLVGAFALLFLLISIYASAVFLHGRPKPLS